jgi:periplasmic divalent cation tolerance protein
MTAPKDHACVLVTAPNITVARKIAAAALTARLVACANLVPKIESHYWWQGQLESSSEVLMLFKTRLDKIEELRECVLKNHPYQTPEFVWLKLDGGAEKYLNWITDSIQPAR